MSRRRISLYSGLVLLAGGLLGWQWWTERRDDAEWAALVQRALREEDEDAQRLAIDGLKTRCQSNERHDDTKWLARKRRTIQALLDACHSDDPAVRLRAPKAVYEAAGLAFYGRSVKRLADDPVDQEMRPTAVRALVAALNDTDADVRSEAVHYLAKLDEVPYEAKAGLFEALRGKDPETRADAARALRNLKPARGQ